MPGNVLKQSRAAIRERRTRPATSPISLRGRTIRKNAAAEQAVGEQDFISKGDVRKIQSARSDERSTSLGPGLRRKRRAGLPVFV